MKLSARCLSICLSCFACLGTNAKAHQPLVIAPPVANTTIFEASNNSKKLFANLSPEGTRAGTVVASPSRSNPNYWFHWTRDGSLTMNAVVGMLERSTDPTERATYKKYINDYLQLSRENQLTNNPTGGFENYFQGFGEPKFNVDGSAYWGSWGRPQNDGPALRALTVIHYIKVLESQPGNVSIRSAFYDADPAKSLLKGDLEFVAHHWFNSSFDLWEEMRADHFYTQLVQRRALLEGAQIAAQMNDPKAADYYRQQASALEGKLNSYWDSGRGYIGASQNRTGGLDKKDSNLDAAVVLGVLHARSNADSFFTASDDRVMATVVKLREAFRGLYPINRNTRDSQNQEMGVAIGRYPEDVYDGNSFNGGNPWFLITNAFAEFYYETAQSLASRASFKITDRNREFFASLSLPVPVSLPLGETLSTKDLRFSAVIQALVAEGDKYLRRARYHAGAEGEMSEQMDRYTGFMKGAHDLTWSYASTATALWNRAAALNALATLPTN